MVLRSITYSLAVSFFVGALHSAHLVQAATGGADSFYKAYYLETEKQDWSGAADLYKEALGDSRLSGELRAQAKARMQACREELASADFASLVPPTTLAYVEFTRPGEHLEQLLSQLGLLRDGSMAGNENGAVAISPELVRELTGLRGAALAVTGFDPIKMQPTGVIILNPGRLEVIRGLLETGLPIGGKSVEPIDGFPTYNIENEAFVTLTSRLVIAGTMRSDIDGVIARLTGRESSSLKSDSNLAKELATRDDSMLFFCLNARPVMGMANIMLAAGAAADPNVAVARALLDPDSLRSVVGKAGIGDKGLFLDVSLRLSDDHRNLVYNFLRTPAIDRETLRAIPSGAAAFIATALNPPPGEAVYQAQKTDGPPVITALDFGREIFANITTLAAFVLAPDQDGTSGWRVPDAGVVLTVNDPSKSEALWTQMLGIASLATGSGAMEGAPVQVAGIKARSFTFPGGVRVLFATDDHDVIVASNENVLARSLAARNDHESVLDDPGYANSIGAIGSATTKAIFAHPGRLAKMAMLYTPGSDRAELAKAAEILRDTVALLLVDHSNDTLHFGLRVAGVPDVGPLLGAELAAHRAASEREGRISHAIQKGKWDAALAAIDASLDAEPGRLDLIEKRCKILTLKKNDVDAANVCLDRYAEAAGDNAMALNNLAWALLTEERFGEKHDAAALKLSERACKLTGFKNWAYLDTLALAEFRAGNAAGAVKHQREAVRLAGKKANDELKSALAKYENAAGASQVASGDGS